VTDILLIIAVVLLIAAVVLLLMLLRKASQVDVLASRLDAFEKAQERTERAVREEVAQSRDELGKAAREQRQELTEAFKIFGESVVQRMMDVASTQKGQLDAFSSQLASFAMASGERLDGVRAESATGAKQLREEVIAALKGITEVTTKTMGELANVQKAQLEAMALGSNLYP
jgi:DNA recombination protein RmuC